MFWQILQALFLLIFGYIAFRFAVALKRQREKEAEGVVFSGPFAYFRDSLLLMKCVKERPHDLFTSLFNDKMRDKDGNLPEALGYHLFGTMGVFFNKPKYVEELFVTKNAFYSKHVMER